MWIIKWVLLNRVNCWLNWRYFDLGLQSLLKSLFSRFKHHIPWQAWTSNCSCPVCKNQVSLKYLKNSIKWKVFLCVLSSVYKFKNLRKVLDILNQVFVIWAGAKPWIHKKQKKRLFYTSLFHVNLANVDKRYLTYFVSYCLPLIQLIMI